MSDKVYYKYDHKRFPYHIFKETIPRGTWADWFIHKSYCSSFRMFEYPGSGPINFLDEVPNEDFVCRNCIKAWDRANG